MMPSQPNSPLSPSGFGRRPSFSSVSLSDSLRSLSPAAAAHPYREASFDAARPDASDSEDTDADSDQVHLTGHAGPSSSSSSSSSPTPAPQRRPSRDSPQRNTHRSASSTSTPHSGHGLRRPFQTPPSLSLGQQASSSSSSPIAEKSSAALRAMRRSIRRVSLRVVNFDSRGLGDEASRGTVVRLPDADDSDSDDDSVKLRVAGAPSPVAPVAHAAGGSSRSSAGSPTGSASPSAPAHLRADSSALVGKSLGLFTSESRVRQACWRVLSYRWTEPIVLLLIVLNVVLIIIQAERPQGTRDEARFFRRWEDYCLVVLFVVFTLEAAARIIVSGLLFDPYTAASISAARSLAPANVAVAAAPAHPVPSSGMPAAAADGSSAIPLAAKRDPKAVFQGAVSRLGAVLALTGTTSENARRRELKAQTSTAAWDDSDDDDDAVALSIAPLQASGTGAAGSSTSLLKRRPADASTKAPSFVSSKLASTLPASTIASSVPSTAQSPAGSPTPTPSSRAGSRKPTLELPFQLSLVEQRRIQSLGRPYLRHSWNRVDAVAIVCFWIMLALALAGLESQSGLHLYIFRALSILRAGRLLLITSGTATILHSLKRAAPLLANVFVFLLFAIVLFSIIGVQSFSGSFRRSCYLIDSADASYLIKLDQPCGAWYDPSTAAVRGPVSLANLTGDAVAGVKGFVCPPQQVCAVADDNFNDGETFDNVLGSALQVFVIASANGWSDIMYSMMDSEYKAAAIFFVVGLVVLNFWLSQLFVAVVVNSFSDVRAETRRSAFGADLHADPASSSAAAAATSAPKPSRMLKIYEKTHFFWVVLVVASLSVQATITVGASDGHLRLINHLDLAFSLAFGVEILIRLAEAGPDFSSFFGRARNWLDLTIAVVALIIEIPVVRDSEAHGWLVIFPLARWYRVILVVPRMKPLLLAVFGQVGGLLNMTAFLGIVLLLAAILAIQLFQDDLTQSSDAVIKFDSLYNAILGAWQVFSSENWTTPLNNVMAAEWNFQQAVIGALFLCGWFVFSNFIMLQMFVAVLAENFSVAADSVKRERQLELFLSASAPKLHRSTWIDKLNPYRFLKAQPTSTEVQNLPPSLVLPLKRTIVRDHAGGQGERNADNMLFEQRKEEGMVDFLRRALHIKPPVESFAMDDLNSRLGSTPAIVPTLAEHTTDPEEHIDTLLERREHMAQFISRHPSYDVSLFLFRQTNAARRLCQKLVPPPAGGERIFGRPASPAASFGLKAVIYLSVIASVVIAAIATPAYRRERYDPDGELSWPWYDVADCFLAFVFVFEFVVKVVADGFMLGPNAYLRSLWNAIDGLVLVGLLVNTVTTITSDGGLSNFTRSLKAVRCLRLITLSSRLRSTLYSILVGIPRILDASVLVVLYMIPYAVWGVVLFRGKLFSCSNPEASGRADCIGEYLATPIDGVGAGFPLPQVWANPSLDESAWAFDDFRQSILILFEIVSLEGWTDVMASVMQITGEDRQPSANASPGNALFLLFYNLFGAVIILTLFVTIIIQNFSSRSGAALLTSEQRQWVDLRKTIQQQQPAKRPKQRPSGVRAWCFDRAVQKHGWWATMLFASYVLHCVTLLTQSYANSGAGSAGQVVRDCLFLLFGAVFAADLLARFLGLGWHAFRSNKWSIFNLVMVSGATTTTVLALVGALTRSSAVGQLQKVFLVGLCLNLIERSSPLNQLFKTALASLPALSNLILLWLAFFVFFAVLFLEVFGLTKLGSQENRYANFRDFGSSLILLSVFTSGEAWNSYMHDHTVSWPRCTQSADSYLQSDCGSTAAAYGLFIAWNVLSMYLLVNVVTGCVVESFAYVFTLPGAASLDREQIRAFKMAWAATDVGRTDRILRDQVSSLLFRLTGVLEVRPFPPELGVRNLLALSAATPSDEDGDPFIVRGRHGLLDVRKLNAVLDRVDYAEVKRRRRVHEHLYREAVLGEDIAFGAMLELLAHHLLIDDERALLLDELLRRRERTDQVREAVAFEQIKALLLSATHRRRLDARRHRRLTLQSSADGLPSIVLDPTPPPRAASVDITSAPSTPTRPASRYQLEDFSPANLTAPDSTAGRRLSESSTLTGQSSSDTQPNVDIPDAQETSLLVDKMTQDWGDMLSDSDE